MKKFKVLDKQVFINNHFSIKPIELNKRYEIMKWRNEQMFHLRQNLKLKKKDQDQYFSSVISKSFDKKHPDQILFSFYYKDDFIGYGGLVHIDWNSLPNQAQDYMDSGEDSVQMTPMPPEIAAWVADFVEKHHVDEPFIKRKRKSFDPKTEGFDRPPPRVSNKWKS